MGPRRLQNTCPRDLTLRAFTPGDGPATFQVFYDAVHHGTANHYAPDQRAAWAPTPQMPDTWEARQLATTAFVAQTKGAVAGFMTLTPDGLIDMAFVRPSAMGTGVAARLYDEIEAAAVKAGLEKMTTGASHLARPFFVRRGWVVLAAQVVHRNGQALENFRMEKALTPP